MTYEGNDNYGRPKSEYLARLVAMKEDELRKETERKIWLAAYAENNPRSDYHWHARACYEEWVRRGKAEVYQKAYDDACCTC